MSGWLVGTQDIQHIYLSVRSMKIRILKICENEEGVLKHSKLLLATYRHIDPCFKYIINFSLQVVNMFKSLLILSLFFTYSHSQEQNLIQFWSVKQLSHILSGGYMRKF